MDISSAKRVTFRSRRPCINLCSISSLLLRIWEMGPDRRETTLHCDSTEQKPDCQISLSAAISDNKSTVRSGVCASKILVSAPRFLMRRHRPIPGVREDGAQAARPPVLGSAGDRALGFSSSAPDQHTLLGSTTLPALT